MYHAITRSTLTKVLQFKHIPSQVIRVLAEEYVFDPYLTRNNKSTPSLIMQVKIASINNFEIIYNANNYITPGFAYLDEKSIQDSNKYVIKHHKQSIERSAAHKITSAFSPLAPQSHGYGKCSPSAHLFLPFLSLCLILNILVLLDKD